MSVSFIAELSPVYCCLVFIGIASLLVQFNGSTLLVSYVGALPAVDQQDGRVESEKMKTKINIVSNHINVK